MSFLFWCAAALLVYTYFGYPLLMAVLARLRPAETAAPAPAEWPEVTVVMAAYNERARIDRKIANLRALDYPQHRLHIVVVSDGSTDGTQDAAAAHPGVRVLHFPGRHGKPHGLNRALEVVTTPVVLFNDVRQAMKPDALKLLVARLQQPGVGAVSGELVHLDPQTRTAANIGLYWRYEKWIRAAESRFRSTVGATGAIYVIRTADFVPLAEDAILDDFELPMAIARTGQRVLFEGGALLFDELQSEMDGERKRKVRTLTGNYQAMARHPWMFSPLHNPLWLQFMSHKVFRLVAPYAMVIVLATSLLLARQPFYFAAAVAQVAFYLMAAGGMLLPRLRRSRLVSFSAVFVEMNLAAVVGLYRYVAGRAEVRWEKT